MKGGIKIKKYLFTIGHSKHSIDNFIYLLQRHSIDCIVDVRSSPFSRICPQFNQNDIKRELKNKGITYIFMGIEFGARRTDLSLYTKEGYLDFEKTAKSKEFLKGVERIENGLRKNLNIAFMCTEKNPIDCHRNILVAHEFSKRGYQIQNIHADGTLETQQGLEKRLLDMYFPTRLQVNLFEDRKEYDEIELVAQAYKLRNKDIAYSIEGDEE